MILDKKILNLKFIRIEDDMRLAALFRIFVPHNQHYMQVFAQQTMYLRQASTALCQMAKTMDRVLWRKLEKEIKVCEVQGDALLTEFYEHLYEVFVRKVRRIDIQTIAMNIDEFLDNINDCAKSIPLYMPKRIDSQIYDLAQYIDAESDALKKMMSLLGDMKKNYQQIAVQCDRITELEHAADDTFAEYIGYIFTNESDPIELMKYKNIAEAFEAATDAAKRVSDSVRKIIMRYQD